MPLRSNFDCSPATCMVTAFTSLNAVASSPISSSDVTSMLVGVRSLTSCPVRGDPDDGRDRPFPQRAGEGGRLVGRRAAREVLPGAQLGRDRADPVVEVLGGAVREDGGEHRRFERELVLLVLEGVRARNPG